MLVDIVIVVLLILLNGVLAMAELAVVSAPRARLKHLAATQRGAQVALDLLAQPTRFLSTVQVGITTIGILAGAFGGATIAEMIDDTLQGTVAGPYGEAIGVAVVVFAITIVSVILGELVPKRLAMANPEGVAIALAPAMNRLAWLASPAVWFLSTTSEAVLRALRLHQVRRAAVTEEEIRLLIEEWAKSGAIELAEQEMVERVLRLGDRHIHDVMTPRMQVAWLDLDATEAENLAVIRNSPHSRYPVTRGGTLEAVGVVQMKDLMLQRCTGLDLNLFADVRPPLFIPETTRALKVLEKFKTSDMHLALVVDEYGAVSGVVTLNDILESIVGDLSPPDEGDNPSVVRRKDGSLLIDGMLPADDVKRLLHLKSLHPEEEHNDFSTLAGMVLAHLERIPKVGESFAWSGWTFEVMDMDGPRVDKVLVVPKRKPATVATPQV